MGKLPERDREGQEEIAFAQTYFALQTRRAELIERRLLESERVRARKKLTKTEKDQSKVIVTLSSCSFGRLHLTAIPDRAVRGTPWIRFKAIRSALTRS